MSMLKSRCLKLKMSMVFSWEPALWTHWRGYWLLRMRSQKNIAIFTNKQWLLSCSACLVKLSAARFLAGNQLYELKCPRRGWWWCGRGQKKTIAIFGYKQWLLSLDMKTKIVQHVPRINISIWHVICKMLGTCWTTFVFMSRLKSHCL